MAQKKPQQPQKPSTTHNPNQKQQPQKPNQTTNPKNRNQKKACADTWQTIADFCKAVAKKRE